MTATTTTTTRSGTEERARDGAGQALCNIYKQESVHSVPLAHTHTQTQTTRQKAITTHTHMREKKNGKKGKKKKPKKRGVSSSRHLLDIVGREQAFLVVDAALPPSRGICTTAGRTGGRVVVRR